MIAIQTIRLETSPLVVIDTYFGTIWLARMIITIILLGIWFGMDRSKTLSKKNQIPMLVVSLALISTTTLIGHGAASEQLGNSLRLRAQFGGSSMDWRDYLLCLYFTSNIFQTWRN